MRLRLFAGTGAMLVLSCLAPDIEIVTALGTGGAGGLGAGGLGNVGGALSSGGIAGTSNPLGCPPELAPQIAQFPCTQAGLECDYGSTHCVCQNFLFDCITSSSGGSSGAGNGGAGGNNGGSSAASGGSSAGSGGTNSYVNPCQSATVWIDGSGDGYYVTQTNEWTGSAFPVVSENATLEPAQGYFGLGPDDAACACGSVPPSQGEAAGIGFYLNQSRDGSPESVLLQSGLQFELYTSIWPSQLRIQIAGPNADIDPEQRWCIETTNSVGFVEWQDFQFECWPGGANQPFDWAGGQPITSVSFLIPGDPGVGDRQYDFCVSSFVEQ